MKRGEHGDRNVVKANILVSIIVGIDTYEGLKGAYRRGGVSGVKGNAFADPIFASLCEKIDEYSGLFKEPPYADPLIFRRDEVEEALNSQLEYKSEGTSPKDIHYHLMNKKYGLVAMGIIAKTGNHYRLRTRSVKDALRILALLSTLYPFREVYNDFFNAYVRWFSIDGIPLILYGKIIKEQFDWYMALFFGDKKNIKNLKEIVWEYWGFRGRPYSGYPPDNIDGIAKEYWAYRGRLAENFLTQCEKWGVYMKENICDGKANTGYGSRGEFGGKTHAGKVKYKTLGKRILD